MSGALLIHLGAFDSPDVPRETPVIRSVARRSWPEVFVIVAFLLSAGGCQPASVESLPAHDHAHKPKDSVRVVEEHYYELRASSPNWRGKRPKIDDYVRMIRQRQEYGGHSGVFVAPTGPTTFKVAISEHATLPVKRIVRRTIALGYFWIAPLASREDNSESLAKAEFEQGPSVLVDGLEFAGWVPLIADVSIKDYEDSGGVTRQILSGQDSVLRWKTCGLITQMGVTRIAYDVKGGTVTDIHVQLSSGGEGQAAELKRFYFNSSFAAPPRYVGFEFDGAIYGCSPLTPSTSGTISFTTRMPLDEAEDMAAVIMAFGFVYPAHCTGKYRSGDHPENSIHRSSQITTPPSLPSD